jgi:hypothetical protein
MSYPLNMRTQVALGYTGPAVDSGHMDVYEASANMIAFSEFVVAAAKATYGESVVANAQVAGFAKGSFVTDLVFELSGMAATVFSQIPAKDLIGSPKALIETIRGAIDLWRHLKGSPPKKVDHHTNHVSVENNNGNIFIVTESSLNLVFNAKATGAAEQFIGKALRDGIDAVEINTKEAPVSRISQAESGYFVDVVPSEIVTDQTLKMVLMLEAAMFKDGNKWRFSDGQQSFFANIEDKAFLARVDGGERFGKGDLLTAQVRISQEQAGMKLTAERTVVKVIEHKSGPRQLSVFE